MTKVCFARVTKLALAVGVLTVSLTKPAYAYLDPVSVTFILQAIAGAIAAILASIKSIRAKVWGAITAIFRRASSSVDD